MSYDKLSEICFTFRKRQEQNRDVLIIFTGEKGDGKSNAILQLGRSYVKKFGLKCNDCRTEWIFTGKALILDKDEVIIGFNKVWQPCPSCKSENVERVKEINFKLYMGYKSEEMKKKISELPPYSPLLGDEAANWALGEDWGKKDNKDLKKRFIQIRTKKLIIFANIPEFATMDSKYRNMANYWVRVMARDDQQAIALFMRKSKAEVKDKWFMDDFNKLMGNYFEDDSLNHVENISHKLKNKHPCVYDVFKIPKLDHDIYERYEKYRDHNVFGDGKEEEAEYVDRKLLLEVMTYNLMRNWHTFLATINKARCKRPTYKIISDTLFINPTNQRQLGSYVLVKKFTDRIDRTVQCLKKLKPQQE